MSVDFVEKSHRFAADVLAESLRQIDIERIAKHNKGYMRYAKDPVYSFVFAEKARFIDDVKYIYQTTEKDAEILDAGTFIPVIPLMLKFLGYKCITVVEKFSLYDGAIDPVLAAAKTAGIEVIDADITQPLSGKKYDLVLLLAVIEHFSSSPLQVIQNLKAALRTHKSRLLISVPNIARLENRIKLLLGKTPLVDIEEFLLSEFPFTGHSREYTIADLYKLAELSQLSIQNVTAINYSPPQNLRERIFSFIRKYGSPSLREMIRVDTVRK